MIYLKLLLYSLKKKKLVLETLISEKSLCGPFFIARREF
jgi:hypothetical protein